jgi:glycosyltransferase involved in cell wall biosynthesis
LKKKVLIFGPIGDFGGRDVEVNIIVKSLMQQYDVKVFSISYISGRSFALEDTTVAFSSLEMELYAQNSLMRFFSFVKYIHNRKAQNIYAYVKNRFSRMFFDFRAKSLKILEKEIKNADAIIACVQLSTNYLTEVLTFEQDHNVPFLLRTTGTIRQVKDSDHDFIRKITYFIHHSEANAANLNVQLKMPYTVIDQCALTEKSLLALKIKPTRPLTFGFIGRLSIEKGILPLVDSFLTFPNVKLIIAGDGPLRDELLSRISSNKNISYIGHIANKEISGFFKEIDCLIIPSHEESGPLVGLEAMAAGKLIVSTRVGAMSERLKDTGNDFWFDIDNPLTLPEALINIQELSDEKAIQISESLRRKYLEDYQVRSINEKYLDVLTKFIGT